MADDDSSDLSSLESLSSLSPAPSDDESDIQLRQDKGILKFFHKLPKGKKDTSKPAAKPKTTIKVKNASSSKTASNSKSSNKSSNKGGSSKSKSKSASKAKPTPARDQEEEKEESPPPPKREPSPPHEYVLADNQDIAFIVMFRNRLADAFPKNMSNFGPQELESDIVDGVPGQRVEYFLCALLKLLLNRQQDVKPGHYHRALEEAVQSHKSQWLTTWGGNNPLADGKTFTTMSPVERLTLLRALILWAMSSSKVVHDIIDHTYKGKRNEDDSNVAMSVQPWGNDSDKRRYYLIEGRDDTAFRVYRESNPAGFINRTWWSVAGSIEEIRVLIERLETKDGGPRAKKLAKRLAEEIPRFEAGEEKRRRREYRQMQRDRFKRPEPGFSLYEGRTRGKRIKYTYSDDEDFLTDSTGPRRSTRHTGTHTPAEPVTTASGRQIRAPNRLSGGLSASASVQGDAAPLEGDEGAEKEPSVGPTGRPRRSAAVNHGMNGWAGQTKPKEEYDEYDSQADEEDEDSEPELGDDEEEDEHVPEDEEEDEDEEAFDQDKDAMLLDEEDEELGSSGRPRSRSVVVTLPVHAVLDQETGKWSKQRAAEGEAQRLSGATTPIEGDGDVTMAGSVAQSSDVTATSPVRTGDEIVAASVGGLNKKTLPTPPQTQQTAAGTQEQLVDKPAVNGAALSSEQPFKDTTNSNDPTAEKAPVRPGTPGKENSVPATAALAYRGSPEKSHSAAQPVDVGFRN